MKRIIPIAVFLGFVNLMLWIEREPSVGLSLNRIFVGILTISIFMLIMLIVAKKIKEKKTRLKRNFERKENR